jgi:hypothetical protein
LFRLQKYQADVNRIFCHLLPSEGITAISLKNRIILKVFPGRDRKNMGWITVYIRGKSGFERRYWTGLTVGLSVLCRHFL